MANIKALTIQVTKQSVFVTKLHEIVNDSKNVYEADIQFDEEWDGYAKTIVWKNSASGSVVTLLIGDESTVQIPNKVTTTGSLYVGFYGHLNDCVLTTQPSTPIRIYGGCGTPPVIADVFQPSEYDRMMEEFAKIYEANDSIQEIHTELVETADVIRQEYTIIQQEYNELSQGLVDFNTKIADFNEKLATFESESELVLESIELDKSTIEGLKSQIQTMDQNITMNYENAELVFADMQEIKHDIDALSTSVSQNAQSVLESVNSCNDYADECSILAQRAQTSANSAHNVLDEIELYAGQVNRDVAKAKTYYDYIVEHNSEFMRYYIITFDGSAFKHNGTTLTYQDIKTKCLDTQHFVYAQYNNRLYIPQYISNNNIFFDATYIDSDTPQIHRISINTYNQVSVYDYVLAKSNSVPSDQHINDLINAKLAQLVGSGVSY